MSEQAIAAAKGMHPLTGEAKPAPSPKVRKELERAFASFQQMRLHHIKGSYDAARDSTEFQNYWANADALDADSANSSAVRKKLRERSRYECANNGYSDGIASTHSTHLVGPSGPALRMSTGSDNFNRMVEERFFGWCKAVGFSAKLWTMSHAKHVDGEAFGVLRLNPRVNHQVKLDLVLHEAEQCATPLLPMNDPAYIDGIKLDQFGNPLWYDFLSYHPGALSAVQSLTPERVPAEFVLHWFKMRRPGQHRGVPEMASTLNTGAAARRWREATLAAAETAADFTLFLKTQFQPDSEEMQYASDFSQQEITKRMMTALPIGYEPFQMEAKHPTTNHEAFHRQLVNEQGRAVNMPTNISLCDSANYNYASGRLDHQTYYSGLDVDREGCSAILDRLFSMWFRFAVPAFRWFGGDPDAVAIDRLSHQWDFPKHRVADIVAEAEANRIKLQTGAISPSRLYTEAGFDFEDELVVMAKDYGLTTDEMRAVLLKENFPIAAKMAVLEKTAAKAAAAPMTEEESSEA